MKAWGVRAQALLVGAVVTLVVTGCATRTPSGNAAGPAPVSVLATTYASPPATAPAPPWTPSPLATTGPAALTGVWSVQAQGETPNAVLAITDQVALFRPCGTLLGGWAADRQDDVLLDVDSWNGSCASPPAPGWKPRWLTVAASFAVSGTNRQLLDSRGRVVAVLSPSKLPAKAGMTFDRPGSDFLTRLVADPAFAVAPASTRLAQPSDLIGSWVPTGADVNPHAFVRFAADGNFDGSDGCNGLGGSWRIAHSTLLVVQGPITLVACDGMTDPINNARSVLVVPGGLEFFDGSGKQVGSVHRGTPAPAATFAPLSGAPTPELSPTPTPAAS